MEQNNLLNEFEEPKLQYASTGQRLANYLIDLVVYYLFVIVISFGLGYAGMMNENSLGLYYFVFFLVYFVYYGVMEGSLGKTLGKMVTKTKVLNNSGEPITYKQAFLRTLCRIVPFEFFSAFSGGPMWHDKWADTILVKE